MSKIIFELERFLRWLASLSADEKHAHSGEISEAAQAFADTIEEISDAVDPEDEDNLRDES